MAILDLFDGDARCRLCPAPATRVLREALVVDPHGVSADRTPALAAHERRVLKRDDVLCEPCADGCSYLPG